MIRRHFAPAFLFALGALLGTATCGDASTFFVPSAEFPTLQSAFDFCRDGDSVEVAPGVYSGDGNRDLDFRGRDVHIYSSGGAEVTVIECGGTPLEPHRGLVVENGEPLTTTFEGFTVQNAYALGEGSDRKGGAVLCRNDSNLSLRNCRFRSNNAARGAGIYVTESGKVEATGCVFQENHVELNGGAISVDNGDAFAGDCTFIANVSEKNAAAIGILRGGTVELRRCVLRSNSSTGQGGALFVDRSSLRATECEVTGNNAGWGGALFAMRDAEVVLQSCTVAANFATEIGGGLLLRDEAAVEFEQSILWGCCDPRGESDAVIEDLGVRLAFRCSALRSEFLEGEPESIHLDGEQVFTNPQFCDPVSCADAPTQLGDYGISAESDCTEKRSPCRLRVGAAPVRCGATPGGESSWGLLKTRWRTRP